MAQEIAFETYIIYGNVFVTIFVSFTSSMDSSSVCYENFDSRIKKSSFTHLKV